MLSCGGLLPRSMRGLWGEEEATQRQERPRLSDQGLPARQDEVGGEQLGGSLCSLKPLPPVLRREDHFDLAEADDALPSAGPGVEPRCADGATGSEIHARLGSRREGDEDMTTEGLKDEAVKLQTHLMFPFVVVLTPYVPGVRGTRETMSPRSPSVKNFIVPSMGYIHMWDISTCGSERRSRSKGLGVRPLGGRKTIRLVFH